MSRLNTPVRQYVVAALKWEIGDAAKWDMSPTCMEQLIGSHPDLTFAERGLLHLLVQEASLGRPSRPRGEEATVGRARALPGEEATLGQAGRLPSEEASLGHPRHLPAVHSNSPGGIFTRAHPGAIRP